MKNDFNRSTRWLCVTAMFMALNVVMSSFGIPVPGGHFYLNDVIICTAAILLDPLGAFLVGGRMVFRLWQSPFALIIFLQIASMQERRLV